MKGQEYDPRFDHSARNCKASPTADACARHGRHLYDRNRDLARIIPQQGSIAQCDIVKSLIMIEDAHEKKRRQNDAAYFVTDHVECLSALLAESVLLLQRAEQTA